MEERPSKVFSQSQMAGRRSRSDNHRWRAWAEPFVYRQCAFCIGVLSGVEYVTRTRQEQGKRTIQQANDPTITLWLLWQGIALL